MIDINTATQNELDRMAEQQDSKQGERVMKRAYDFIGRFVSYPSDHERVAHTLWCLHAHLIEHFDTTPRLAFLSPEPGSGKSRALEMTALLTPRVAKTMNATPAYIYRKIQEAEGRPLTIIYDEIDALFGSAP